MTDLIHELKEAADNLERAQREAAAEAEAAKLKPAQVRAVTDIPMSEAYNRLHAAGMKSFCIQMEVWNRNYPTTGKTSHPEITWQVWDGTDHTQRKTLEATVAATIEKWQSKTTDEPAQDLAVADAALA